MPGADPQTMASSVATPLELQFGEIPGLTQMTSASALGHTEITLQFDLSRAIDGAVSDTLSAINAVTAQLPLNMPYPPTIQGQSGGYADPVLAVTSDSLLLTTVYAYAENILLQKISQISGVGLVGIGGQQKPAIRVEPPDPQALAARGINLEDVRAVLGQANVDLPKGMLNSLAPDLYA